MRHSLAVRIPWKTAQPVALGPMVPQVWQPARGAQPTTGFAAVILPDAGGGRPDDAIASKPQFISGQGRCHLRVAAGAVGGFGLPDVVTIATTNHFEAIDEAPSTRAGRFDAHVRMGYPTGYEKQRVLDLYLDRFSVADKLTRRRLQIVLAKEFAQLQLVTAHIQEFVKAGVKRARLARRALNSRTLKRKSKRSNPSRRRNRRGRSEARSPRRSTCCRNSSRTKNGGPFRGPRGPRPRGRRSN